ncbi:MAG TPA: Txe/YoeB family addiction module toxin [Prolixibacteraceae bacterium]|nr:Txe/YoeB family addiction module toxin [Prolixibacteraceae bacterium]
MEIDFIGRAIDDIEYWKRTGNVSLQKRIAKLLTIVSKTPYSGIGKPEQLKHDLSGYWSRRINNEHRLVYRVKDKRVKVISLRYHYF